jgi:hypothetical protein
MRGTGSVAKHFCRDCHEDVSVTPTCDRCGSSDIDTTATPPVADASPPAASADAVRGITVPLCESFKVIGIDISEQDLRSFEAALYQRGLNVALTAPVAGADAGMPTCKENLQVQSSSDAGVGDPTAMTGTLTKGQQIVADYEADMIAEPCELAAAIDRALAALSTPTKPAGSEG